jgi:hypothetical protein
LATNAPTAERPVCWLLFHLVDWDSPLHAGITWPFLAPRRRRAHARSSRTRTRSGAGRLHDVSHVLPVRENRPPVLIQSLAILRVCCQPLRRPTMHLQLPNQPASSTRCTRAEPATTPTRARTPAGHHGLTRLGTRPHRRSRWTRTRARTRAPANPYRLDQILTS